MGKALLIRRLLAVVTLAAALAGAFLLRRELMHHGLSWTADVATIAALFIPIAGVLAGQLRKLWSSPARYTSLTLADALHRTASIVAEQLTQLNSERSINDPGPMNVQFRVTRTAQTLMKTVSFDGAVNDTGEALPEGFSGSFTDVLKTFTSLPTGRLVIIGQAGAGKSALVARLASDLLAEFRISGAEPALTVRPATTQLVPLILRASEWKPDKSLTDWISDELVSLDYELLSRTKDAAGKKASLASLISSRYVLPVIDGLDELPAERWTAAVARINELGSDRPLVLTARDAQYAEAIAAAGREISRAVVVEVLPLSVESAERYLRESASPGLLLKWQSVFDRLEAEPGGALASALTNPLNLWLCRQIYAHGDRDPSEVTGGQLASRGAIENHLLDEFLPAVYRIGYGGGAGRWSDVQAQRWLSFLAFFLGQSESSDISWWRLNSALTTVRLLGACVKFVLLAFLYWNVTAWLLRRGGDWVNGHFSVRAALSPRLLAGPLGPVVRPALQQIARLAGRSNLHSLALFLSQLNLSTVLPGISLMFAGFACAILFLGTEEDPGRSQLPKSFQFSANLVAAGRTCLTRAVLAAAVVFGVGSRMAFGRVFTSREWVVLALLLIASCVIPASVFLVPLDVYGNSTPAGSLRRDRMSALGKGLLASTGPIATAWLCFGSVVALGVALLCLAIPAADLATGSVFGAPSAQFADARIWLALYGRMPWRALAFLEDARKRGALGRAGAVYRFRHLRLQRRLAETYLDWRRQTAGSAFTARLARSITIIPPFVFPASHAFWAARFDEQARALEPSAGTLAPAGPVFTELPGVAQRYRGCDGRDWVMCALARQRPVLIAEPVWDSLPRVISRAPAGARWRLFRCFPSLSKDEAPDRRLVAPETKELEIAVLTTRTLAVKHDGSAGGWAGYRKPEFGLTKTCTSVPKRADRSAVFEARSELSVLEPFTVVNERLPNGLARVLSDSELARVVKELNPDRQLIARQARAQSMGARADFAWWWTTSASQDWRSVVASVDVQLDERRSPLAITTTVRLKVPAPWPDGAASELAGPFVTACGAAIEEIPVACSTQANRIVLPVDLELSLSMTGAWQGARWAAPAGRWLDRRTVCRTTAMDLLVLAPSLELRDDLREAVTGMLEHL